MGSFRWIINIITVRGVCVYVWVCVCVSDSLYISALEFQGNLTVSEYKDAIEMA